MSYPGHGRQCIPDSPPQEFRQSPTWVSLLYWRNPSVRVVNHRVHLSRTVLLTPPMSSTPHPEAFRSSQCPPRSIPRRHSRERSFPLRMGNRFPPLVASQVYPKTIHSEGTFSTSHGEYVDFASTTDFSSATGFLPAIGFSPNMDPTDSQSCPLPASRDLILRSFTKVHMLNLDDLKDFESRV